MPSKPSFQILVYEYLTGGGLWSDEAEDPQSHPLLAEGSAMAESISQDLQRIDGVTVVRFQDARLGTRSAVPTHIIPIASAAQELAAFAEWSPRADGVLLIAPECGGRLLARARWVEQHGGRLLSPNSRFIELATDKSRTAEALAAAGVPVPHSCRLDRGAAFPADFPLPAVLKPNDGVGSCATYLVTSLAEGEQLRARQGDVQRVEAFCPGLPASVLAMCGARRRLLLPPCGQRISTEGEFKYLGGSLPLAPPLAQRAAQLARATLGALPRTRGFVGVDLILGEPADGSGDVVLEVNPRLTTSYVGLRRGTASNLAAAMLTVERGGNCPLFFHRRAVEFGADGRIHTPETAASIRP